MTFKEHFRSILLQILMPFVRWMGTVVPPFSVKQVMKDWYKFIEIIKPLDIILSNTYGHLSNVFNPSLYKHAIVFIGWENNKYGKNIPMVIESLGIGTIKRPLIECISEKDKICIIRYNKKKAEKADISKGIAFADAAVGKPYDYLFDETSQRKFDSFYCSELAWYVWESSYPKLNFVKRKTLGVDTVQPSDFYDAACGKSKKTLIIFESAGK